jgi:hypothetical protein
MDKNVVRMGETRNMYRIFVEKPQETKLLHVDETLKLRWISKQ